MTTSHLHLPGFAEVEALAILLVQLADNTDSHMIPLPLRSKLASAASALHEHDRSARNFVKKYESKWGYTLFGRCLGQDSALNSAVQKNKFAWMRYNPQASEITDESRLLYVVIKMLKNRPNVAKLSSPTKSAALIKGQYKRIGDRIRDDPTLSALDFPLPNINAKSITSFMIKEEKRANYLATAVPKALSHRNVISDAPMPDAPTLPTSLPVPSRAQVQYAQVEYDVGKRRGEKRRLDFDTADVRQRQFTHMIKAHRLLPLLLVHVRAQIPVLLCVHCSPSHKWIQKHRLYPSCLLSLLSQRHNLSRFRVHQPVVFFSSNLHLHHPGNRSLSPLTLRENPAQHARNLTVEG